MDATPTKPDTFEDALQQLEKIVASMEAGELPLESSLAAYQQGVELVKLCQTRLSHVEQQVKVLEGELLRPINELGEK